MASLTYVVLGIMEWMERSEYQNIGPYWTAILIVAVTFVLGLGLCVLGLQKMRTH